MKKIFLFILIISLTYCNKDTNIKNNTVKKEIKTTTEKKIIETVTNNKITNWNQSIKFTNCITLEKGKDYSKNEDIILLKEKINKTTYIDSYNYKRQFPTNINEYCKNKDSTKYIFWSTNRYNTIILGKYDKTLNILEIINYNGFFDKDLINKGGVLLKRNYGDTSLDKYLEKYININNKTTGFGLKYKNIIPFSIYGVSITGYAESAPGKFAGIGQFFSKKSKKYCSLGITPGGKLSVCFVDIFYNFDFIKNKITESRICSYYIDDNGEINTLEKCFNFKLNNKGYKLKSQAKGIAFYQDKEGFISILDIDLNSSNIDFGGISNSNLDKFNRFYATELPKTFKREYYVIKYTLAIINGQFFNQNKNPTALSFPLKSNGKIINSKIDNNKPKKTFIIDNNGNAKILEGYKREYINNKNYKELIVGFNPDNNANKNSKIGRTYIGINNPTNIVFFIAQNKTQEEMNKIIYDYGVKKENIIMMDGGPSSQFAYYDNNGPGSEWGQFYGEWKVPHYFIIYTE